MIDFKLLMDKLQVISNKYGNVPKRKQDEVDDSVYCPDCSSPMIKRKSKWGSGFWLGCSGYPRCSKTLKC